jgi:hypothetical protein
MINFFKEGSDFSMMRLLSFLSVCTGIIISGFVICFIFIRADISFIREAILLVGTLLGFGFGGKALQKFGENDSNKINMQNKNV